MISVDARIREEGYAVTWEQEKGGGKYVLRRSSQIGVVAASLAEESGAGVINGDPVSEAINHVRLYAMKVIERNDRRRQAIEARAKAGTGAPESEGTDSARLLVSTPNAGVLDSDGGPSTLTIRPPDPPSWNTAVHAAGAGP